MTRLSVVIPVHQGGRSFERCLERVHTTATESDELIVVLDGDDASARRAAEAHDTRVVALPVSRGPAAARNAGAGIASGDVIVFIDADVEVRDDTFRQIRSAFEENSLLDAIIGSYDDAPSAPGVVSRYRNLLHHYTHQHSSRVATTFWGACGAIRAEVFRAVGGFDERYAHPSIEDIEMGYRISGSGFRIELRKDVLVKHLKRWSASDVLRTDTFRRAAPWTQLLLERRTLPADLNLQWHHRLSVISVGGLAFSAVAAIPFPLAVIGVPIAAAALLGLNMPFYRFLTGKMGILGTIAAIPWHWAFYACNGVGAALGAVRFLSDRNDAQGASFRPAVRTLRESA